MAEHNELGEIGEALAADHLLKIGYKILAKNYTFGKAEVDIIAQIGDVLVAVEVKTRSSIDFGLPQEAVKTKKIQSMVAATNQYVLSNDLDLEVRFDVIAIHKNKGKFELEHLENAFYHF